MKAHTMEMLVIEEDVVGGHVILQDLARCPRGVLPHIRAVDARVCHGRQIDFSSGGHSGRSNAGRIPGARAIRAVLGG